LARQDALDEIIVGTSASFLGLTVGCARCHDHKFDPITTDDYYALAGIFKSTQTMESLKTIAKWHENEIATADQLRHRDEHTAQVAAKQAEIQKQIEAETARLTEAGIELTDKPELQFSAKAQAALSSAREELATLEKSTPELPTAMGVVEGEVTNVQVHLGGSHLSLAAEVARGVPEVLRQVSHETIPSDHSGRLEMARWMASPDHPLTARVMVNRIWRWHFGRGLVARALLTGGAGAGLGRHEICHGIVIPIQIVVGLGQRIVERGPFPFRQLVHYPQFGLPQFRQSRRYLIGEQYLDER
jgi:cytochrome c553